LYSVDFIYEGFYIIQLHNGYRHGLSMGNFVLFGRWIHRPYAFRFLIVKVEIVCFFWYFAKLYQFMAKYDDNKSYISQFSEKFLIFRAYSRDYERYNKIVSL